MSVCPKHAFLTALIILSLVGAITSDGQTNVLADIFTSTAQILATNVVAKIIPPAPYSVNVGETYVLTVEVQYSVTPVDMTVFLFLQVEGTSTQFVSVSGSGATAIQLQLQAPQTAGTYTLQLSLYVRIPGQEASLYDSTEVTYQVSQPVVTDWDVKRAWVEPESPGVGDQVTLHATIWIKSTTSTETLNVDFACYLDGKLYYSGSLSFQPPNYNDQDLEVPEPWTAVEGTHVVTFVVDPEGRYNDPTPYPSSNFKEVQFVVEAYYATIKSITSPPEVKQGEAFNVIVTVEYKLPPNTNIRIDHTFWNETFQPAYQHATDTVSGTGTRDYTFKVEAPFSAACSASQYNGNATVMFLMGGGWKRTIPAWEQLYSVKVKSPVYFAKILSFEAKRSVNQSIFVSVGVDYYLPKETGLRVTVSQTISPNNDSLVIWKDESTFTQAQEPVEIGIVKGFLYYFECTGCSGNSTILIYHATVDYLACGGWQSGGKASTQLNVPNPPRLRTPVDYLNAAVQRIAQWFNWLKKILGL